MVEQLGVPKEENSFERARLLDRVDLAVSDDGTNTLDDALASPIGLALESDFNVTVYFALADSTTLLALEYPTSTGATTGIRLLLTFVFYLALVLLVLAWLLPLLRRLTKLTDTARMFGRVELSQRVPTRTRSDLHALESTFNAMASRIENLVEDNRLLSRGVAHDLRTPLARLRFGIDSIIELDPEAPGAQDLRASQLAHIDADVSAMERLVSVMLEYARFDATLDRLSFTEVDLASIARQKVDYLQTAIDTGRDTTLHVDLAVDAALPRVHGLDGPLDMLVTNLLQNAAKHARTLVHVTLTGHGADGLLLCVEDDGDGIPPDERSLVTRPFMRGTATRYDKESEVAGHGLGLAVVARITEWHNARLMIESSERLGGAAIEVRFPEFVTIT